jgi:hypothetical protein
MISGDQMNLERARTKKAQGKNESNRSYLIGYSKIFITIGKSNHDASWSSKKTKLN